jgi:hypothetical protein
MKIYDYFDYNLGRHMKYIIPTPLYSKRGKDYFLVKFEFSISCIGAVDREGKYTRVNKGISLEKFGDKEIDFLVRNAPEIPNQSCLAIIRHDGDFIAEFIKEVEMKEIKNGRINKPWKHY